jgi:hypothetical protein
VILSQKINNRQSAMINLSKSYFKCAILSLYILGAVSCTSAQQNINSNCDIYVANVKTTEQYKNDSIFLSYTVYKWIDSCYGWFGHYNRRNAANGFYKVHIGDIFYDSTKLKLTAFVFVEYSTDYIDTLYEKVKDMNAHLFDSHTAMGYRDSINKPWKLFEFGEIFMGIRGGSLKSAENFHASIFLNRKEMEERTSVKYYLPCEEAFWTSKYFWKIGERVPGYYNFETAMNATPMNKDLRPVCKIDYPDSLLNLYK